MSHEALAVLTRARAYVEEGWVQGTGYLSDEGGNVIKRCAGQAIQDAYYAVHGSKVAGCLCGSCPTPDNGAFNTAMREFQVTIRYDNIPHWNDTNGRTKTEVLAAFDATIERLSGPKVEVPKFVVVPEPIEVTWKPVIPVEKITIEAPPVGVVKKVLASLGV